MANGFLDLDQVKAQLNIDESDTSQDDELSRLVDAAQEVVERHTGRMLGSRSVTETVMTYGEEHLVVDGTPPTSVESIVAGDGSATYDVTGVVALWSGVVLLPYRLNGPIRITYTAGADAAANEVAAGLIVVQHLWETQRGAMPPVVAPLDDSIAVPGRGYAIPNRALELLGSRPPVVA